MTLRVAVIGSGPAGIYTAEALVKQAAGARRGGRRSSGCPRPYGLVRYGVAPDHTSIKSIANYLRRVLELPEVRFLGGVDTRRAPVASTDLLRLLRRGRLRHRRDGRPAARHPRRGPAGQRGRHRLRQLVLRPSRRVRRPVHPRQPRGRGDRRRATWPSTWSASWPRPPRSCSSTDVPHDVLERLAESQVKAIHMIGRRGSRARQVHPEGAAGARRAGERRRLRARRRRPWCWAATSPGRSAATSRCCAPGPPAPPSAARAAWTCGSGCARWRSSAPTGWRGSSSNAPGCPRRAGWWAPASSRRIPVGMVLRSVGYQSVPLPGVPFDDGHDDRAERGRPDPRARVRGGLAQARPHRRDRHQQVRRRGDGPHRSCPTSAGREPAAVGPGPSTRCSPSEAYAR